MFAFRLSFLKNDLMFVMLFEIDFGKPLNMIMIKGSCKSYNALPALLATYFLFIVIE